MFSTERPVLRRWVPLLAVAVLLAFCFILLSGQTATYGLGPLPDPGDRAATSPAKPLADAHLVLEKNDDYYDAGSVVITRATSLFIDQDGAWTRYQAGQLDTINPPGSALDAIKASPIYSPQLHVYPQSSTYFYGFSHDVPPLDDPRVRAALALAIDRTRLISDVLSGDELPALTFTPPRHFGYVDGYATAIGHPYSPTAAVDLLTQSGYTGDPPITLMVNDSSYHEMIAAAVRDLWSETLGINATVEHIPWPEYQELLRNGSAEERPGVWRIGWGSDYPDAHNWHGDLFGALVGPFARYDNPAYDALVEAAAGEGDLSTRVALYEQVEATLVETDTAILPLFNAVNYRLTQPDLLRTYRSFGGQHLDEWSFSGDPRPIEVVWGAPASLDPALSINLDYLDQLFLGLTDFDRDTGEVLPELATMWAASSDATVYTFTLRSDATWTDANPVTAYDVEYGVLRSLDPATGGGYAWMLYGIENAQEYNAGSITDPSLVGVKALDDTHIRFTLEGPAAYFPVIAGLPPARPQPQWAIEAHGGAWTEPANIVTNGPYKLAHWDQAPYLRISKWSHGDPTSGDTFVFSIQYRNDGGAAATNCVITDTMLGGMTYISDTSGFLHTGSGSGPIVWDLGTVEAYSSAEFEVHVEVTASPSDTITNRAQIATDDPDDQGEAWEKESESQVHVTGPWMIVNYGGDWVQVNYPAGHTVEITVTDPISTFQAYAAKTAVHGQGWWAESGFETGWDDWTPEQPDIQPDYWVEFRSDEGYHNVIRVGTITGTPDPENRSISGNIYAPWFNGTLQVWCHTRTQWPAVYVESSAKSDGSVPYYCQWEPDIWDEVRGQEILVTYVEPNDGDWVTNQFRLPDLLMEVNYGHDWVEGNYEPGHTLWLTVTESNGATEKATATLQTQEIPWWGGRTGFSTNLGDPWDPERPDIQAGDYVYGEMDNGYTSTVRMGLITGTLDLEADTIAGKIYADWFTGPLDGWCGVREEGGPGDGFQFDPDGGSYFCDFGAMDWDLRAGHQVGIQYREPDGDTVINIFEAPWMRVNAGDDWVGGNYPPGHTFWITVTDSLGTPKGYAETVSDSSRGWGGDGFETRDEHWLGIRPDIEPYDRVYIRSDDGYTHVIQVGDIADDLNVEENTISGTITADWFDETLDVRCEVWGVQDGPDGIDTTAEPDGGSFFCDFDDVGWDLQPGQSVAVQYREPDDGDRIINTFQEPAPDMRVEKWVEGSGEALPSGLAVFTIRYRNEGEATANPVIITDTLDTNMHHEADNSGATSTTFDGNQVIWTLGPVAPNEEIQFQLVVSNTANVDDDLVNRVEIYAEHDYHDWNNEDEAWIHIRGDGAADVYVNKNAQPNDPVPGGTYLYEIDYGNSGPVATGPVVLVDTLPTGTRIEDWYSDGGYDLWDDSNSTVDQLILEAPTLPADWGDRIILRVKVNPGVQVGTQLTNTVELDIPVGYASHLHDDVWVGDPRWNSHVDKDFGWGMLVPGGELEYNVHVRNGGNQDTQTWLTDTLPAGTHLAEAWRWDGQQSTTFWPDILEGQTAVWDLGGMLPGQYYDLNIRLGIDHATEPGTVLTNCVRIGLDGDDSWPYDNEDCVIDTVRDHGPNLRVSKDYEWNWDGGTEYRIQYEIRFENLGTETLYDVDIVDTPPAGTHFDGNWRHDFWRGITFEQVGNQLIWTLEELQPGDRSRIRFEVRLDSAPAQGKQFVNLLEAPIDGDVYPDDNYADVTAGTGPDIYVKKWISGGQPTPGGTVTFTVEFGNQNQWPWDSTGDSRIVDTLPPEMSFVTATHPDDPSQEWLPYIDGNELQWDWGWMGHQNWWRFYLVVDIADTVETGDVLVNRIEAWSNADWDADELNNIFDLPMTITLNKIYLPIVLKNH